MMMQDRCNIDRMGQDRLLYKCQLLTPDNNCWIISLNSIVGVW